MNIHSEQQTELVNLGLLIEQGKMSKKDAILKAALILFSQRSFYGTTMPEIAKKAGVGAGTIYRYFSSKEALVNELFVLVMDEFNAELENDFPDKMNSRVQFHHLFKSIWDFMNNHLDAFIFINLHDQGEYLDDKSRACFNRLWNFASEVIQRAFNRGDLVNLDPKTVASLVYGPLIPISKRVKQGYKTSDDLIYSLEEATWRAISIK